MPRDGRHNGPVAERVAEDDGESVADKLDVGDPPDTLVDIDAEGVSEAEREMLVVAVLAMVVVAVAARLAVVDCVVECEVDTESDGDAVTAAD